MNNFKNKRNAFLALFINKNVSKGKRPDIAEIDKWRLGKVKGKKADEIKQFIANDTEIYKWWNQLRQEAKTVEFKPQTFSLKVWIQSLSHFILQPKAFASTLATVFVAYLFVSILQSSSNNILLLANQDIERWQQITQQDSSFQLGMTRQWTLKKEPKIKTTENMKNYQMGLNQFLKKPIDVEYSSIKLCATKDITCKENKVAFTTLGQWVSKANVICQHVNKIEKTNIENRLSLWKSNPRLLSQTTLSNLFTEWENKKEAMDPCEKIQHLIILGAQS